MASEFISHASYGTDRRNPFRFVLTHLRRNVGLSTVLLIGATSNAALAAATFYFFGTAYDSMLSFSA